MEYTLLAEQANDCRRAGEWARAAELFQAAHEALPAKTDGLDRARLLVTEASLCRDRMCYARALKLLAKAEGIFRLHRAVPGVEIDTARCLIKKAIVYDDMGDHAEAQDECLQALARLPRDHRLAAIALYTIIEAELVIGKVTNARAWFESLRPAARRMELDGDPLGHRQRVTWIEAQLLLAENQPESARAMMLSVVDEAASGSNVLVAARALVDLVDCSLRLGLEREVEDATVLLGSLCASLRWGEAETAFRLLLARLAARRCDEAVFGVVLAARAGRRA